MPREIADGETLSLGVRSVQWFDTPHLPHAWECGFLMEKHTRTLLCGDLFTQGGNNPPAITESDHPRPERSLPRQNGLFFPHPERGRHDRTPGLRRADNAGLYARQRVARRRSTTPARTGRGAFQITYRRLIFRCLRPGHRTAAAKRGRAEVVIKFDPGRRAPADAVPSPVIARLLLHRARCGLRCSRDL